jgi:transcriptional regulator with XRE-family HTH domain
MHGLGDHLTIGERIAFYRKRRGYTQEVLAGLVGRSTDWLAKAESGRRRPPRIDMLAELARVLRVPLGDLVGQFMLVEDDNQRDDVPAVRDALVSPRRLSRLLFGPQADVQLPTPQPSPCALSRRGTTTRACDRAALSPLCQLFSRPLKSWRTVPLAVKRIDTSLPCRWPWWTADRVYRPMRSYGLPCGAVVPAHREEEPPLELKVAYDWLSTADLPVTALEDPKVLHEVTYRLGYRLDGKPSVGDTVKRRQRALNIASGAPLTPGTSASTRCRRFAGRPLARTTW